jgi:hypothetical protein
MPDVRRFDPAGVVLLSDVVTEIAVMVEQCLALGRDRDDICDFAVAEAGGSARLDQSLALE